MALAPLSLLTTRGGVGSRPCARTWLGRPDDLRGPYGQQQKERDENEHGSPDKRRSVAVEVANEDPGDDRPDRLRERPNPGPESGHFGGTLGDHEVDQERNVERRPDPVREADEGHDDEGLRDGLHLRTDERDDRERDHADREDGFLADAVGQIAGGDRTNNRPEERREKELERVALRGPELVDREPRQIWDDSTGAEPENRCGENVFRKLALCEEAANIFADVDLDSILRRWS